MIGDTLIEHALGGAVAACAGNRHPQQVPHGLYPCRDGEWISLAVATDAAWRELAAAMGLTQSAAFGTLAARQANEAELDRIVAAWTAPQDARELAAALQARGIAAAKCLNSVDLVADAHLQARGLYVDVTDGEGRTKATVGPSWKMTRPAAIRDAAPALGQHNAQVLGGILGLSGEEQHRLAAAGVVR
jgi:crotonobetainyl-CoA:carnitine CoA-transferase CaiB-like acyl-CoA transferase